MNENLRDYLAAQRTIMAAERTFLAYIRTSIAFFAVGFTLIKFFKLLIAIVIGYLFLFLSILIILIGFIRYRIFKSKIRCSI